MAVNNIQHFENYHSISLYTYDFQNRRLKIVPLTSFGFAPQESIKVKILDNAGLDIAHSGNDFISDVTLSPDLHNYCTNIVHAQYRQKLQVLTHRCYKQRRPLNCVDYSSERYWALTSRLRGYHISFLHSFRLVSHPFSARPINAIRLKMLVAWLSDEDYVDQEEEDWSVSEDSAMETDQEHEYSPRQAHSWHSPSPDSLLSENSDGSDTVSEHSYHSRRPFDADLLITAVNALVNSFSTMLVVEYNEGREFVSRHNIRQIGETVVFDLIDPDGACSCTIVTAGVVHASAWDLDLQIQDGEGMDDAGVNLYFRGGRHHGIVLMGEQNKHTHNYATSIYNNIIVPDLAE